MDTEQVDGIVHIPSCAQLEKRPCQAGISLHGEKEHEHWWTGWPGAMCMKCGDEDKDEVCIGGCECPCHDAFWKEYEESMRNEKLHLE